MFVSYLVIFCTCLVAVFHVHIIVAMTWIICCKIIMLTFKEHDLTIDQVPPNRALPVQPHLPIWEGLDLVYQWVSLMRVPKEGRLCATVAFRRVNGGSLDSQYVLGPSLRGTSFRTM